MNLSTKLISEIYPDLSLNKITDVNASKRDITAVQDLSACKQIRKINLSDNKLENETSTTGLNDVKDLILLNLSKNNFKDFTGFQHFTSLNVLNVSHNALVHMSPHLRKLKKLKALILNNNKLLEIENVETLLDLNTLVISHNQLDVVPEFSSLLKLTKLSAAHNKLTTVPDLSHNAAIKEVRLNDNQITGIPESFRKCSAIEILDFGNNQISDWKAVASLGSLTKLNNLNLKGNPIVSKKDYFEKILDLVPSLRILDGERFDPKFLERKKKKLKNTNIVEKMQRVKRMKVQKEKKERKDLDKTSEEPQSLKDTSEKPKRVNETQEPVRLIKKKKLEENSGDSFFMKSEEKKKPKKVKKIESKPTESKPVVKELMVETASVVKEKRPVVPATKAQTGVLGVIDKTKKKPLAKKTSDIAAALETKDDTTENSGTGLGVSGWD
ncbi:hypothetical protein BY458DRAFT_547107 [Sporodiniella umbellata]|nr:hypothetical protein BY458DRAFT_547107 [Sporodiniella umbellata]